MQVLKPLRYLIKAFCCFSFLLPPAIFCLQSTPTALGATPTLDSEEWAFLSLINAFRAQNGVGPLQVSVDLENSSTWMSGDMAAKNYFSHTDSLGRDPGTRLAAFGYTYYPWGENIAAGHSDAQSTFNQWLNACDPDGSGVCTYAHRQNMLGAGYTAIGIGRAFGSGSTYGWYWTTDFGGYVEQAITPPNGAPIINSFTASPSSIAAGQSTTLTWNTSGASTLSISGVGTVSGNSGSVTVSPVQTTTYTLTASNSAGSVAAQSTVTVSTTPTGTATFIKTDTTTSGSWRGVYGAEGYSIVSSTSAYPSYVTATAAGNSTWLWSASTTDPRATQKPSPATDRIAACWYSPTSFTVDLAFSDANPHQVAVYLLDWDLVAGGRTQRVDILDRNGNVLDTRSVSAFGNGQYLVWNLSGHVVVRMTNTNPSANAVLSAILFGGGGTTGGPSSGTAAFVKTDTSTSGSWRNVYGAEGYNVVGNATAYPSYVTPTVSGNLNWTWAASTTDTRAPQKAPPAADRIAACWYASTSFTLDFVFNDTQTHQVAIYLLDYDAALGGRSERIDIVDTNGNLLDTRSVTAFTSGQYLVWNLSGHVMARIVNTGSSSNNAVISGVFFGGAPAASPSTATFVKTDTTTSGSWQGVYGADGYNIVNNAFYYPGYVAVTPSGYSTWTWFASTTDPRALQKAPPATDRIAACWYSSTSFRIDLAFTDGYTHQIALYLVDYDAALGGRSQRVDIFDQNGTLLDSRSVSAFTQGQYLVWNVSGHVVVQLTNTATSSNNAVISGLFFR